MSLLPSDSHLLPLSHPLIPSDNWVTMTFQMSEKSHGWHLVSISTPGLESFLCRIQLHCHFLRLVAQTIKFYLIKYSNLAANHCGPKVFKFQTNGPVIEKMWLCQRRDSTRRNVLVPNMTNFRRRRNRWSSSSSYSRRRRHATRRTLRHAFATVSRIPPYIRTFKAQVLLSI